MVQQQRPRRLPHLLLPSTRLTPAPLSLSLCPSLLLLLTKAKPPREENLIHGPLRMGRGAACSRLRSACHSLHVEKKIGHQTRRFFFFRSLLSLSFFVWGPIKEPCEGPLEKANRLYCIPDVVYSCTYLPIRAVN